MHVILRDAFGTNLAEGDLTLTGAADSEQLKAWFSRRVSYPILNSTPHPEFPLELLVNLDG